MVMATAMVMVMAIMKISLRQMKSCGVQNGCLNIANYSLQRAKN